MGLYLLKTEPPLSPPEPKVIYTCSWCDDPIYDGEECFDLRPYGWCCQQCMDARLTVAGDYDG